MVHYHLGKKVEGRIYFLEYIYKMCACLFRSGMKRDVGGKHFILFNFVLYQCVIYSNNLMQFIKIS